jgi:acyl carrier protein
MSIEENIRNFILKNLYFAEDPNLSDNDSFLAEGIVDSMGVMELVTFVETEFGIKVDMSEVVVKNFDSISQLAAFVRRKMSVPGKVREPHAFPMEEAVAGPQKG